MKKTKMNVFLSLAMFLFAGIVIILACRQSNQALSASPLPLKFVGEYSQNGGEWKTLKEEINLSAFDGDLSLRGKFDQELPEGTSLFFYLDHISMDISVNGENTYELSNEKVPELCGSGWNGWLLPKLLAEDKIVIKLHNPHRYGNTDAYKELLSSFFLSGDSGLKNYYEKKNLPYRIFCICTLIASIALIGTAISYLLWHLPNSGLLLKLGIMSLFMGVYMYLDAKDISLRSEKMVFNTDMRHVAILFASWMLCTGVAELLQKKRKKIAEIAVYVLMLADFVFLALSLTKGMKMYDTGIYWAVIQGMVSLLLLVLCVLEGKKSDKKKRIMLLSAMTLLAVMVAELMNARLSWWTSGICIKAVFGVLFVVVLL